MHNIREQGQCPRTADLTHIVSLELRANPDAWIQLVKVDAKMAHKRVRVLRKDWRYFAARFPRGKKGHWFIVNRVGTYGVSSAQYWWGRIAGLINRVVILIGLARWCLVYVDDFLAVYICDCPAEFWEAVAMLMLFLEAIGFPMSWKTFDAGRDMQWIGHHLDLHRNMVRPTEAKIDIALEFLWKIADKEIVSAKLLERRIGLIRFMSEVLPLITPFLQPLHTWVAGLVNTSLARPAGRPGELHRAVARFIISILNNVKSGELPGHSMFLFSRTSRRVWVAAMRRQTHLWR